MGRDINRRDFLHPRGMDMPLGVRVYTLPGGAMVMEDGQVEGKIGYGEYVPVFHGTKTKKEEVR
jgi:hypothetical protein